MSRDRIAKDVSAVSPTSSYTRPNWTLRNVSKARTSSGLRSSA
ncbi:hypothetical protein [Streptomyces sp. YS-3]